MARRVCTILARGGSKGLPGKNLRMLAGKPLIAHSVIQAKECGLFDTIVVSSDDAALRDAAVRFGAGLVIERPAVLATDTASKLDGIHHAVEAAERAAGAAFDTIVDLDVTAPLREVADIKGAVALFEASGATNVITGAPARRSPYFNLVERAANGTVGLAKPTAPRIERRQDAPPCFDMNAAIYVWRRHSFMERADVFYPDTLLYEMPEERSHDIDSALDFEFVEFLINRRVPAGSPR